jgi:DNA uptake protein ComE-like DNA-binding protein
LNLDLNLNLCDFPLRPAREPAENGAVRNFFLMLAAAALLASPAALPQTAAKPRAALAPEARVDINHASMDELMAVPGMTQTWAVRIVRFRPYRTKQDLLDRGVLSGEVYDRIKDSVIAHREKQ